MKKQVLFTLLLTMLVAATAQDTILTRSLKENYFYNHWPIDTIDKPLYPIYFFEPVWNDRPFYAKNFHTTDTLEIIGISVALHQIDTAHYTRRSLDLSYDNVYEYFSLYEMSGDTLRIASDSLLIHQHHTPVAYYMNLDFRYGPLYSSMYDSFPLLEVYEAYFDHPYRVNPGQFFVGYTTRSHTSDTTDAATGIHYDYKNPRLGIAEALVLAQLPSSIPFDYPNPLSDSITFNVFCDVWYDFSDPSQIDPVTGLGPAVYDTTILRCNPVSGYMFLFPILAESITPDPHDTITPNPHDTITADSLVVHPGNTLILAPGSTLIIGGDTVVNTGDTVVVNLGDTLVIGGVTIVISSGDTLVVDPGGFLILGPDGSIVIGQGSTVVVNPGAPAVGISGQPDFVYRYTSVQPNPATDRVKVLSSFGLTRIEVYDTRGRLLHDLPASGLKATLDVSSWPRGTYLLRILTPVGQTTKKLLVQ